MFTGIVEEIGKVNRITQRAGIICLEVSANKTLADTQVGQSIAVNGVCLTVAKLRGNVFVFEVMHQTHKNTNLGLLKPGQPVNLERSLKVGDRISGHFVYGHIDCLGLIRRKTLRNGVFELEVSIPPVFKDYCLPKGSVSIDGVSLTLAAICANVFTVHIIPHTLKNTTLNFSGPSDKLNVEFDILAKKNFV